MTNQDKETYYFTHDFGARHELQEVLMKLGHEGKSVFWDLVEQLHEQGGYLPLNKIEALAFSSRTTPDLIKRLISKEFGLFKHDNDKFWSESALRRIQIRLEKRQIYSLNGLKGAESRWKNQRDKPPLKKSDFITLNDIEYVNLTKNEHVKLQQKFGEQRLQKAVELLDSWLAKGGKTAKQYIGKPHYAHFRKDSWLWERVDESLTKEQKITTHCEYVN